MSQTQADFETTENGIKVEIRNLTNYEATKLAFYLDERIIPFSTDKESKFLLIMLED